MLACGVDFRLPFSKLHCIVRSSVALPLRLCSFPRLIGRDGNLGSKFVPSNIGARNTVSTDSKKPTGFSGPEEPTYNQVKIQMFSRSLQKILFGQEILRYDVAPTDVLSEFAKHNIDIDRKQPARPPVSVPLPDLLGANIEEHMLKTADCLLRPYMNIISSLPEKAPSMPQCWSNRPGWTKYSDGTSFSVLSPSEDALVFDTEVLMEEGDYPTLAVALSPTNWYSWVSPSLYHAENRPADLPMNSLIRIYDSEDRSRLKIIIGHFVSFDRARIFEEYDLRATGIRFIDTLSLHVAVSGLTSTQRHLKTTAKKQLFNNKLWQKFIKDHSKEMKDRSPDDRDQVMDLQWISETSLNNLTDVYQLYCMRDPPQSKQARSVFESGTKEEVQSQFQELMTYCATDVLMTFEVLQKLLPLFKERFPHPATLYGMLEMGSMYLPINDTWTKFQQCADSAFAENELRQKKLLMQLADEALMRYSNPDSNPQNDPWLWDLDWSKPKIKPKTDVDRRLAQLPKWYRDLIPKPVKDNLDVGPALLTAQMRIAPKLLRLCWQGLPLHYDQELKWGVLIPGRAPRPYGDPRFYEYGPSKKDGEGQESEGTSGKSGACRSSESNCAFTIRSVVPAIKSSAAGQTELSFPYGKYLAFWLTEMRSRLIKDLEGPNQPDESKTNGDFTKAYCNRMDPDNRDDLLMRELERSVEAMPLELEERCRLAATIHAIRKMGSKTAKKLSDNFSLASANPIYEYLGEMQARGSAFWMDSRRYENQPSGKTEVRNKQRPGSRQRLAVDTVNPVIPTCWFCHLPHEKADGLPIGSPLSRSFQSHIAANRLHIARFDPDKSPTPPSSTQSLDTATKSVNLANQLLLDRIHATFWQGYSKRIKEQMAVWLPHSDLPEEVRSDKSYDPKVRYGAILPQVISAGTVSRRAVEPLWLTASNADKNRLGSEIKAMVQAPPGYCFVGADVDSQEMWIAALIGDASIGFQGATPYGWMTLEGNKADGTDLHTKIAQIMGISRTEAKVLNYGRLYGSGYELTKHLLTKFSNLTPEQASLKARQLLRTTKGQRVSVHTSKSKQSNRNAAFDTLHSKWQGGTESAIFNELERIARSPEPCTPVLHARLTRALNPKLVQGDFLPSRINWVVQSSAVDYLHCMIVVMAWLIQKYQLPARLCISIHDEVRYMCRKDTAYRVALALQISNLFTRTFFAYRLGMRDLPESVAYFSSVEIDNCLRKSPNDDCITPSNPEGLEKGYGIAPGQSLSIQDILTQTGGSLEPVHREEVQERQQCIYKLES
ncbi:unnamed protein product [Calicophoron daubneyi]|uniref:Mitochondrial DNA polymerase catalytic subunit n=1 Tax=Calicophoron daubneyi TaxID=300641 RepID=A0AAV2TDH4_CALDB